jgi:hypothetical protein
MTIQELIAEEINTDCDYQRDISCRRIIDKYEEANDKTKSTLDDIFISLSGWSLKTHIENYNMKKGALTDSDD